MKNSSVNEISEKELFDEVDLCDKHGNLNPAAVGWSRQPVHRCNLSGHPLRKKRWNYWCFTTPTHLFSVTLSDVDYAALPFVYLLDYATNEFYEKTLLIPFGSGSELGERVGDPAKFSGKGVDIEMLPITDGIDMHVHIENFGGKMLEADFSISRPEGHESLNVVIPWSGKNYQFTSKDNTLPTVGKVRLGEREIKFEGRNSYATLDFGRGVWPYQCFWNWSSFSTCLENGRSVGVNLGAGWTDGTGLCENGLCVDGKLTKLSEDIKFSYDPNNFMLPWQIKSTKSDRVDLTFTPFFERIASTNAVIVGSEVHQMIGRFSGRIKTDEGEIIGIDGPVGWAEDHHARW